MITAARDTAKTALNGLLLIAVVFGALVAGPHVELAISPPVNVWELTNVRFVDGQIRWSVLIDQRRQCVGSVVWETGGISLSATGPAVELSAGERREIGPFSAPIPIAGAGPVLSATVTYNCGLPWGLAPIRKTAIIQ